MGPGPNVSLESLHNGLRCISHLDTNGYAYTRHGKASGEFDANHVGSDGNSGHQTFQAASNPA